MDNYLNTGHAVVRGDEMSQRYLEVFLGRVFGERGAVAMEYSLLAAFVGAMIVVTITILGGVVVGLVETIGPF